MSPIELDLGIAPRSPIGLSRNESVEVPASAAEIIERINDAEITAFRAILASQDYDKQRVDSQRREERYAVGDSAWLDTRDLFIMNQPGSKKLRARFAGPFEIVEVQGDLNVKLKLPAQWRIHPIVHIARLKRAHDRNDTRFPADMVVNDDEVHWSSIEQDVVTDHTMEDLSDYNTRGAAVAQIERELLSTDQQARPRTRAQVQRAHDSGERYDVVISIARSLPDSALVSQTLGQLFSVPCAAPRYLLQHGVPEQPEQLMPLR